MNDNMDLIARISKIRKRISNSSGDRYLYKYFDELVEELERQKGIEHSSEEYDELRELIEAYARDSCYNTYGSANWVRYSARCFYCADYLVRYLPQGQSQNSMEHFLNLYFVDLIDRKVAPIISKEVFDKYFTRNITPDNQKDFYNKIIKCSLSGCGIRWSNRRGYPNSSEITLSLSYTQVVDSFIREYLRIYSDYSLLKEWIPDLGTRRLADFWYNFPDSRYYDIISSWEADKIEETSDKMLDIQLGLYGLWYWHNPQEVIECLSLDDLIEILEVTEDDEFEKVLRHAATLPFNEKVKGILEHFADDDEMWIVRLSQEVLSKYN